MELLRSAVEEFQIDHGLTPDGKWGPSFQAKLKEVYGC
jgi:peptidoglycan hydrolase-like protein with peptidoglycan-binding domain